MVAHRMALKVKEKHFYRLATIAYFSIDVGSFVYRPVHGYQSGKGRQAKFDRSV